MIHSFHFATRVVMGFLDGGGVVSTEIFFIHERARLRLRGIGVAESERTSISDLRALIFSLSRTQNRCSSSITKSQRFLKIIPSPRIRWVPITQSIVPSVSPRITCWTSFGLLSRVKTAVCTANGSRRFQRDSACSYARTTRGEIRMDCFPLRNAR